LTSTIKERRFYWKRWDKYYSCSGYCGVYGTPCALNCSKACRVREEKDERIKLLIEMSPNKCRLITREVKEDEE